MKSKLQKFGQNASVRRKSAGLGIRGKLFSEISDNFVKEALAGTIPRISASELLAIYNDDEGTGKRERKEKDFFCIYNTNLVNIECIDKALLSAFYNYAEPFLPEESLERFNSLRKISDLRFPSEWFPDARQMRRYDIGSVFFIKKNGFCIDRKQKNYPSCRTNK